jgi:cytochrome P450
MRDGEATVSEAIAHCAATAIFLDGDTRGERLWDYLNVLREVAPLYYFEPADIWIVSGYNEVRAVSVSNAAAISFAWRNDRLTPEWRRHPSRSNMIEWFGHKDNGDHLSARKALNGFFLPPALEKFGPYMDSAVRDVVAAFKERSGGNFLHEVAYPLTTRITDGLLNLSPDKRPDFRHHIENMGRTFEYTLSAEEWTTADDSAALIRDFWHHEISSRYANPLDNDFLSQLISRNVFSREEMIAVAENILVAATDTTANTATNGLLALLTNPRELEKARIDEDARAAIPEEVLRFASAAPFTGRGMVAPLSIGGVTIPEGGVVVIALGAANRDPTVFSDPNRFSLSRATARRVAPFGHGIHICLGQWLVRAALNALYRELLAQCTTIEFDGPVPALHGLVVRRVEQVNVRVS